MTQDQLSASAAQPPEDYRVRGGLNPTDGYVYGWLWDNGDFAWWSTREQAERHPTDFLGQSGRMVRRRYEVGEVEWV